MPFLLRKKTAAQKTEQKNAQMGVVVSTVGGDVKGSKVVSSMDSLPSLSAMSIHYDSSKPHQPTYQQPAPSRPQQSYQQSHHRPYTNVLSASASSPSVALPAGHGYEHQQQHLAQSQPSSSSYGQLQQQPSLEDLRGLQTAADGSFKRPATATAGNEPERRQSVVQAKLATRRRSSTVASSSRPPLVHASTSDLHYTPDLYTSSAYQQHAQPKISYHRRSGSLSSESSYAASEGSDILYNSANGRSSSGGTSATTPSGFSDNDRKRSSSVKHAHHGTSAAASAVTTALASQAPMPRPSPPVIERVPVPSPMLEDQRPQQPQRPISEMSTSTLASVRSAFSPTPSQTSSMIRKTSSRYTLADFNFIRTLGTGSFGRVHLVKSCHNSRFYAIKVLNKERVVKMKQVEHTNSEREMLERVRHPFLVNLWGTFKDCKNLYMVMDFVSGGELFSLLRKSQRFPDPVAKFFAAEVALALDYLHSLDIIYRDLKPENILLAADGHVKVTDFGFAKYVPDITWTLCGTPDYLAPEVVQSKGYNKSVDWYALGVLIFEMLAGYPPFFTEDSNPMRLYEKIIAGKIRYPSYFTEEAKDLLRNLLTADLTKRFGNLANGSRDIFGHAYFSEVDWSRLYRKEIPAPYVPRIEGDGDSSNFDSYAEIDISEYGVIGPDPHGHLFTCF